MKVRFQSSTSQHAILIAPALVIFTLGMIVPIFLGIYYSMTNWNGLSREFNFVWLKNYSRILTDPKCLDALRFTIQFVILNTLVQNVLALAFAIILDTRIKTKTLYRTIIFAPVLLSPILVGYLWKVIFAKLLPNITQMLGVNWDLRLLAHPSTVLLGVVIINNWQWIGYWMMVYLAALQSIPKELYEAAEIDGAAKWHKFWHITLPMVAPAITVCVVAITLGSFRVYEVLVTSTAGGPGHASESIVYYTFQMGFGAQQPAYASAISMVYLLFLLSVAVGQLCFFRKREVQL